MDTTTVRTTPVVYVILQRGTIPLQPITDEHHRAIAEFGSFTTARVELFLTVGYSYEYCGRTHKALTVFTY